MRREEGACEEHYNHQQEEKGSCVAGVSVCQGKQGHILPAKNAKHEEHNVIGQRLEALGYAISKDQKAEGSIRRIRGCIHRINDPASYQDKTTPPEQHGEQHDLRVLVHAFIDSAEDRCHRAAGRPLIDEVHHRSNQRDRAPANGHVDADGVSRHFRLDGLVWDHLLA